ncbi:MAG TPA: hypothetical protein PLR54_05410 [Spirochaetota bacterium]|nr:hypothetical protein [Spirochaetota bacterium]HPK43467.1 hypothetical protein [Spirochaetota bacterium]HQK07087.1 hypothetical protein [Spirochaetota bacterium]HRV14418.1 hypothetical protein [Spirochaetota bacterium]
MNDNTNKGFRYYIDDATLNEYQQKHYHLRLQWLYMGNKLRKGYSSTIKAIQDSFRRGEGSFKQ